MAFHCPAVDIGTRQNGRLRGMNVLHVDNDAEAIFAAIGKSITDQAFRDQIRSAPNPYGKGDAGPRIAKILTETDLSDPALLPKQTRL